MAVTVGFQYLVRFAGFEIFHQGNSGSIVFSVGQQDGILFDRLVIPCIDDPCGIAFDFAVLIDLGEGDKTEFGIAGSDELVRLSDVFTCTILACMVCHKPIFSRVCCAANP